MPPLHVFKDEMQSRIWLTLLENSGLGGLDRHLQRAFKHIRML